MSKTTLLLLTLSFTTLMSFSHAHGYGHYHECKHDSNEFNPDVADVDEAFLPLSGRLMASVSVSISTSKSTSSSSSSSSSTSNNNTSANTTNTTNTTNANAGADPTDPTTVTDPTTGVQPDTDSDNTTSTDSGATTGNNSTNSTNSTNNDNNTVIEYPNIRIYAHYDSILVGSDDFKTYVREELLPPVISLLQAAIKLKYPLTSPMKLSQKTLCGVNTPDALTSNGTGIETDFVLLFTSSNDTASSWVASSSNCLVSSLIRRPLVAQIALNVAVIKPTTLEENPLGHEFNIYILLHEILHGLGISQNFFSNYVDDQGILLKNHIKKVPLSGTNRTVVDLAPLTERLRNFYGCPSLEGAFMENDGGSGTAGSHWERRFFPFDLLSSGAIHGRRITEFTLAFLEGTGWYAPDYSYAEPYFYGQGAGCDYIYGSCTAAAQDVAEYSENCIGNGRGCSNIGRGGGFCKSDTCSDGCRFVSPQFEYDCENPNGIYYTPFASKQSYGREAGSKCFSGNLTTSSSVSKTTYCFKYNCVGSGLDTQLQVSFGTSTLICEKKGPLAVSGYKGAIDCPDPLEFCSTVGKKYCPRGCMGRGKCMDNKCVCDTGFKGIDCAFRDI